MSAWADPQGGPGGPWHTLSRPLGTLPGHPVRPTPDDYSNFHLRISDPSASHNHKTIAPPAQDGCSWGWLPVRPQPQDDRSSCTAVPSDLASCAADRLFLASSSRLVSPNPVRHLIFIYGFCKVILSVTLDTSADGQPPTVIHPLCLLAVARLPGPRFRPLLFNVNDAPVGQIIYIFVKFCLTQIGIAFVGGDNKC
jgi:hypothetical protein